ncbi:probable ABC transporter ATP-binding protein [Plesiocystis pacifica SIR-1]|uniref:Probable ABC transporter ATP-binding protein n=1 Tax=Plesiocystis pacifica SIR-1 TaxID=391625 RepID=A6G378_9BACT|nr:ABC transporter ATP-binding protein [Plesiocystis pacifica]EDM79703.1 probable ABC transporter ATP-binding protein [Plesiocystis pacifica SIR-1]
MLELTDLRKRYGEREALGGVTLRLRPGEVFGLLGPNGAGKSTLCGLVVGSLTPDGGSVRVAAGDPREPAVRRRVGFAPQPLALYAQLSGAENLAFFAGLYGLHGARRSERIAAVLDFVGLRGRADDRVGTYSGGMARRLNLAVALLHEPELLLLDEPTVGVDPQSRDHLLANIESLRDAGVTVLYTTHYMEEAQRLCDRVGILDRGRLLAVDATAELLAAHAGAARLRVRFADGHAHTHALDGEAPLDALRTLAAALEPEHGAVERFAVDQPSLEDVFLELTGRSLRDT